MKQLITPRQKIMMRIHLIVNLVFYANCVHLAVIAFKQGKISQLIWTSLFSVILLTDAVFHLWSISIHHKISVVDIVPIPSIRVALITTKAPSEPWSVVKTTLEAMLNQSGKFHVWLADENPSADTTMWCAEQGINIISRKGVDGYHNTDWPRRTKCKEGNLAYFYDTVGYDKYDVVFQFDSDHAPTHDYLSNSLPAFADPDVSYIAMPNINKKGSWISNARQTHEAWYYGPSQMSYSYDNMPMCTGSHYAVRTSALKDIGGIGPELDEDMTTTIMMVSHGKRGVYASNAIAYGEGPLSLEDAAKQEFQWGKSAMISFVRWRRVIFPKNHKMRASELFRFYMIQVWYFTQLFFPLYVWFATGPTVFTGEWCTNDCVLTFGSLIVYSAPIMVSQIGYNIFMRRHGFLRPYDTPFVSIDLFVYRALRPIWNGLGIIAGVLEMVFNIAPSFSVTRKGESSTEPLGIFSLWYLQLIYLYYAALVYTKAYVYSGDIPMMLIAMLLAIVLLYTYIVFRHFKDQHFKALTWTNPVCHSIIIIVFIGSLVYISRERVFTKQNVRVFIPSMDYATIVCNGVSLIWAVVIALI